MSLKRFVLAVFLVSVLNLLFAEARQTLSLQEVLPSLSPQDRRDLLNGSEIMRFHGESVSPGLLPLSSLGAAVARELISGGLNIGIEGLFFTPLDKLPDTYSALLDDDRDLKLYNMLRSVSTLTGLHYYSASRKKMRLLFEESWVIPDGSSPKEVLPDPFVDTIPVSDFIYIHQRDKSFAKNQSKMTFQAREDSFAATIVNITHLRYMGLLRVVNSGDMQTHIIVVPVKEGLLLYGAIAAKTLNIKAFRSKARDSFTNRVIALIGWYRNRLQEEFRE